MCCVALLRLTHGAAVGAHQAYAQQGHLGRQIPAPTENLVYGRRVPLCQRSRARRWQARCWKVCMSAASEEHKLVHLGSYW